MTKTRILVIDDEAILREELVDLLTFAGYSVTGAENGVAGIDYAHKHHPDVILCDVMMPQLDGYQVLTELRNSPPTADIPFIFMTARAAEDDIRQGLELGAARYITKPFRHKDLIEAIEAQLPK
jgi:CheY-like chemotaxis protein